MTRNPLTIRSLPLLTLVLLLAAAPLALAQPFGPGGGPGGPGGPGGGPGDGADAPGLGLHLHRLAAFLDLTDAQITQAQAIFEAARDAAKPLRETQMALHEELRALLESDAPDATAVGELVLELHANRKQIGTIHEAAWTDFKALLTAEQLDKLEQLGEVRRHFGHGRGGAHQFRPGFGAGPGPGPGCGDCPLG